MVRAVYIFVISGRDYDRQIIVLIWTYTNQIITKWLLLLRIRHSLIHIYQKYFNLVYMNKKYANGSCRTYPFYFPHRLLLYLPYNSASQIVIREPLPVSKPTVTSACTLLITFRTRAELRFYQRNFVILPVL